MNRNKSSSHWPAYRITLYNNSLFDFQFLSFLKSPLSSRRSELTHLSFTFHQLKNRICSYIWSLCCASNIYEFCIITWNGVPECNVLSFGKKPHFSPDWGQHATLRRPVKNSSSASSLNIVAPYSGSEVVVMIRKIPVPELAWIQSLTKALLACRGVWNRLAHRLLATSSSSLRIRLEEIFADRESCNDVRLRREPPIGSVCVLWGLRTCFAGNWMETKPHKRLLILLLWKIVAET